MSRPKEIAERRDDITWKEVKEKVKKKKEALKKKKRKYKNKYTITNTVAVQQESYPEKILVLDEIKYDGNEETPYQYRFGYWVVSDKKLEKGSINVVFGQFASIIPPEDIQNLLKKAKETAWEGPGPMPFE